MNITTIYEAVSYLYSSQIEAEKYFDKDLPHSEIRHPEYVARLLKELGNPDLSQFNIKVTGSKGKGSVSKLISTILQSQGYKVGLFTGPHLIKFNERIRINDEMISDEDLIRYTKLIQPIRDRIMESAEKGHYLGKVGSSLAIALKYFEDMETDFNILEMGIGARYDSVNPAHGEISVINPIFSEHLRELGGSFQAVADNKSYIIQRGQKATFWANQDPLAQDVLLKRAKEENVKFYYYGKDFMAKNIEISPSNTSFDIVLDSGFVLGDIKLNMLGKHQAANACLAFAVAKEAMNLKGREVIDLDRLAESLSIIDSTGRFEVISQDPLTVLDGAINRKCARHIKETLIEIGSEDNIFIIGVPDDKDYIGTVEELKTIGKALILTKAKNKNLHFDINQYEVIKEKLGPENLYHSENIEEALTIAYDLSDGHDSLCIVGTQSLIGDTKKLLSPEDIISTDMSLAL